MRILLLTDSLGTPRKGIEVEKIWTYKFLMAYSKDHIIFTQLTRGLSTNWINYEFIEDLKPDLVICQVGIVDATRRTINRHLLNIIKRIPIMNHLFHDILRRYHYIFTKIGETRYAKIDVFQKNLKKLIDISNGLAMITIAPSSSLMELKVYKIKEDINHYNDRMRFLEKTEKNIHVIDPFTKIKEKDIDKLFLEDGHHLSIYGNEIVFKAVEQFMYHFM